MQTARRLYLYLMSGIGLGVLVAGVSMLLTVLFEQLGLGPQGNLGFGDDEPIRQQLTLASALTVVSLPVWLLHWRAAERSVATDRPGAAAERTSGVRGLYFALAMGALLLAAANGVGALVEGTIFRTLGADELDYRGIGGGLALALAAGAAWLYHVRLHTRDWAAGPMTGDGAWLPRAYLYLATFVGLMILLAAVTGAIELVGRLLLDEPAFEPDPFGDARWWVGPLATAISGLVIGGAVWLGHAAYAERLIADSGWRGASERPAGLRLAYFVAVMVATVAATIYFLSDGLGDALGAALGIAEGTAAQTTGLIVLPIVSTVPYVIAWVLHRRRLAAESTAAGTPERVATAERLELYPAALVGLAFAALTGARVLGLLIDALLGQAQVLAGEAAMLGDLAWSAPFAVVGFAVWAWHWQGIGARWVIDPVGEAASTTRRTMLLIVSAVSVLAGILAAGFILYRLFGSVFGIAQSADALGELSLPIAGLLVAAAVATYHAVLLRRDQSLRVVPVEETAAAAATPATTVLRLTGPAGAELDAVVRTMRDHLPPGYGLEVAG